MMPGGMPGGMQGGAQGGAADIPEKHKSDDIELPDTIPAHMHGEPESELKQQIVAAISEVYDPEIPVNVYDLGLIYHIAIDDEQNVGIVMTLTAPNCPAAGILPGQVEDAARNVEGVGEVKLELTFDPPFSPAMMSDEAKLELGFM